MNLLWKIKYAPTLEIVNTRIYLSKKIFFILQDK